ncbi:MAG: IPT/TIG domain-containing protein [Thermoanaerobaculia bacterium]
MNTRNRWRVLSALLLIIALMGLGGCKGESPTAPSPGGSGGGGNTPPQGAVITLTVTDRNPDLNGQTTITANVTVNGAAVPNGTAVEFTTDFGTFVETGSGIAVRTTTNGKATATLTSNASGVSTITVRVNNANATTTVTFGTAGITVQLSNSSPAAGESTIITVQVADAALQNGAPVEFRTNLGKFTESNSATYVVTTSQGVARATLTSDTAGTAKVQITVGSISGTVDVVFSGAGSLAITSITPATGAPEGGEEIVIAGRGFRTPVRVLFGSVEGVIISATSTEIRVRTPRIDLGGAQARDVNVTVISGSGTTQEQQVSKANGFRFVLTILTPKVYDVSPSSGPNEGNTRITIMGEGFQSPARVFFGTGGGPGPLADQIELDVQHVSFNQIIAMTPPAVGLGSELRDQQVTMRVLNVASNTAVAVPAAFRYGPSMKIISIGPNQGPYYGGTKVTIYGYGFDDPVAVSLAGIAAQPIRVSGTEIIVNSGGVDLAGCSDISGDVVVTNVEDGGSAELTDAWIYRVPQPTIASVNPSPVAEGGVVTVGVVGADPAAITRFTLGDLSLNPTSVTIVDGVPYFALVIPAGVIEFPQVTCTAGTVQGERNGPLTVDVEYLNVFTGCTDTLSSGLTITPLDTTCVAAPAGTVSPASIAFTGTCGAAVTRSLTVGNTGGANLVIAGFGGTAVDTLGVSVTGGLIGSPGIVSGSTSIFTLGLTLPGATPTTPLSGSLAISSNNPQPLAVPVTVTCTP